MEHVAPAIQTRKVKLLAVDGMVFAEMWRTGNKIKAEVVEGLPEDAQCIGISWEPVTGVARLVFTSTEFPEVEIGKVPPVIDVSLRNLP